MTATKTECPSPGRKPFLSPTQLDMFCKCGEQYRRRYIEGEKIPPGIAMVKGVAFHRGAEHNMRQKLQSHEDLAIDQIVDAAVASFEAEAAGGLTFADEEISRGAGIVIGEAKDSVAKLAGVHMTHQAPDYQPVLVEQRIEIELPGPRNLLGIVDLADDKDRVTDFKTSGRSKNQGDADTSLQLTVYASAFHAITGRPPSEVRLDTLVELKKETKRQVLATSREAADMSALANRINAVSAAIDAGIFPPAPVGAWWCYHMETDLLTESGWRRGWEVGTGELVVAYDRLTGLLSWQPVLATIRKEWNGPMVEYDGRGIRFCVTPDHRMLVRSMGRGKWRETLAENLVGKGSICYPVSAYLPRPGAMLSDDQIALSGWLCAEGHFEEGCAAVCIYQKSTSPHYSEIRDLLQRLKYEHRIWSYSNCDKIRIVAACGHHIRETLQTTKAVPRWLHQADARQFRLWLAAFAKGDGHRTSADNAILPQKQELFLDEVQALCATNRMSAVKSFSTVSIMDGITERITEPASGGTHFVERVADEVWCVTVPTGFVLTRYRGRPLICGNCSTRWCGFARSCPYYNPSREDAQGD